MFVNLRLSITAPIEDSERGEWLTTPSGAAENSPSTLRTLNGKDQQI